VNPKKFVLAILVVGIVANVYDFLVHGLLLGPTYASMPGLFRPDSSAVWFVIGDFIAALVVVWFYARVRRSFGGGLAGGAEFGLYIGVLLGFPAQLFMNLMFVGFPYGLGWIWVFAAIGWGIVVGASAGAVYGREPAGV
jgi:hypothetical protein